MKKVSEMTVSDLLATEEFEHYVKEVLDGVTDSQMKAAQEARSVGERLHRQAIDNLRDKGLLEPRKVVDAYRAILDKSLIGYSASERMHIEVICELAARRTLYRLKEKEKA